MCGLGEGTAMKIHGWKHGSPSGTARHLTDPRRIIADTVSTKSRKRYAGMLVGFVDVNAKKARCSVVTTSRI
jgi:hypothetical protein